MTIATVNCPHCDCRYRLERGDDIRTTDCAACGNELCEDCAKFTCASCDDTFCIEHMIVMDGEAACPHCAVVWANDAVRTMRRTVEARMNARMARATAAMSAWRATAAAQPVPFGESEVA